MRILATLLSCLLALPAAAHEFWIEPLAYQVEPDGMIQGRLVNGELFEGTELAFLPLRFDRFSMASGMRNQSVENRVGNRPALDVEPFAEGLHVFSYQSRLSIVSYAEWAKFMRFADHKDFQDVEAMHDARGLPRENFTEGYWRFAKTLVGVGHSAGRDFRTGLATEFVALENPYTDDMSDGFDVQLYFLDDLRPDVQVELFEKAPDGTVEVTLHRTNSDGIATLPVKPGHSYLADAVVLRVPSDELAAQADIEWETLWAALTFAIPAQE
ncbi:MAG: DUF4198 domain-containing protein [Pseudomonadota bacterium]